MPRCKVGDLAIITGSKFPENNGKAVRCVKWVGKTLRLQNPDLWEPGATLTPIRGNPVKTKP
jgi:hypothetical protein